MSDRGLLLALQRLHDDPGFTGLISQDPGGTLGLYDLDDEERQALSQAVLNGDDTTIRAMAERVGVDWSSDYIVGAGALDESEISTEAAPKMGIHGANPISATELDPMTNQRPTSL